MIEDKIISMAKEEFGLEEVTLDMSLTDDFDIDSIRALEFVMDLEEEFDIEIDDEDLESMKTIGDFIAYVQAKN